MRRLLSSATALALLVALSGTAAAAPTSQIWIPSTDVQPYKTLDLGIYNFFRASGDRDAPPNAAASRDTNTFGLGLTAGVLPFEKFQVEVGLDFLVNSNDPNDQHPWSGNIKMATPENSICEYSPALAVGLYNARPVKDIETRDAPNVTSGQNIVYGLIAKTVPPIGVLPSVGRISAGYYRGSTRALVDNPDPAQAKPSTHGVLLSWDRIMREISDRLWLGVDYQGGRNVVGAFNAGISWLFAQNVSVLFGYDVYTRRSLAGANTFTTQVDIRFP